jgi:hypothetical protein
VADREVLLKECDAFIAEHKAKANSNERRARWATALLVTSTSAIPVFILASTQTLGFLFGKLVPAVLAATGAGLAALLQFERPHERWSLYRRYQRLFEAERMLYEHETGPYAAEAADRRFSEWLARQRIAVHDEWASLVPASNQVSKFTRADGPDGR